MAGPCHHVNVVGQWYTVDVVIWRRPVHGLRLVTAHFTCTFSGVSGHGRQRSLEQHRTAVATRFGAGRLHRWTIVNLASRGVVVFI